MEKNLTAEESATKRKNFEKIVYIKKKAKNTKISDGPQAVRKKYTK